MLGPVFRGYDPDRDRVVAIKAFFLDLTPEQAADLAVEFDQLSALRIPHAFIISPFGGGADGSIAFLVQEYFVADSTDVALKQYGPPPVPDALRLIGQLAGALDAAAAAGVHHGALHLRDVLVAPHEIRLTGLGVVPALERVGYRPQPRRPYAAPERMTGQPVTQASDVYSLACLAFELLTGRRPVPSGDGVTVDTSGIQVADATALSEVFARVLSARPEDRHPSALEFAAALKHALTGAPLQAGAELEPPKPRRAARARKAAVLPFDEEPPSPPAESAPVAMAVEKPAPAVSPETPAAPTAARVEDLTAPVGVLLDQPEVVAVSEPALVAEDERDTAAEPGPEPIAEPAPVVAEPEPILALSKPSTSEAGESEVRMFSSYSHEKRAEQVVAAPSTRLAPLLGMLAVGLVVGFGAGYLVAPRGARGPAAAPAAATPLVQAPAARLRPSDPGAASPSPPPAAAPARVGPSDYGAASPSPASLPPAMATAAPRPAAEPPASAKAAQGTLVVVSKPPGARVFVDGHDGGKTPLTLREVKPGLRKVRLELDGYRPWSSTVRVAAGRQRKIAASLERRPGG